MAEGLKPIYLITGSDRPKIRVALQRLRARFDPDAVEVLAASETPGDAAAAACNALGLFASGGRLVVVEGVDAWKAPDAKAVAAYLKAPAPDTTLALVAEALQADSPLAKECAKAGDVLAYDVPKRRALPTWVAEMFARQGIRVDGEACRLLVDLVGEDADALESEVDKLVTWAGGDAIGEREVALVAAHHDETEAWDVTDAWGRRDLSGALAETESLFETSAKARRDEVARIAASLAAQVQRAHTAKRLAAEGIPPAKALAALGLRNEYPAKKVYEQARNFEVEELAAAVVRMAQLDRAIKGGSRLSGELELARALVDVTGRPDAAGHRQDGRGRER